MGDVRMIGLGELRLRLKEAATDEPLVLRQLDRALARRDPDMLSAAMDSLRLYPVELRVRIEGIIVDWLMSGPAERVASLHR